MACCPFQEKREREREEAIGNKKVPHSGAQPHRQNREIHTVGKQVSPFILVTHVELLSQILI